MIPYLVVMALIPAFACALKPLRSKDKRITLTWIFYGMLAFLAMVRKETVGVDTPQFTGAYRAISEILRSRSRSTDTNMVLRFCAVF